MSKVHLLQSVQKSQTPLEGVWDFFSNPNNLLTITPPFLNLKVTKKAFGECMYAGQIITYQVKPLLGIPLFWMTEITCVEPLSTINKKCNRYVSYLPRNYKSPMGRSEKKRHL